MDCFLVIPCYRESERLPPFLDELCRVFSESELSARIQLVDDGSGEEELRRLNELLAKRAEAFPFLEGVLSTNRNMGKGAAIRRGWEAAPSDCRLLGFADADGAVKAPEVARLMKIGLKEDGDALVVASRRVEGSRARRFPSRRLLALGFSVLTRLRYRIEVEDTQCGCKFVSADWYRKHREDFCEDRFGFDLELILRAQDSNCRLKEVGVEWQEVEGSKVGFASTWNLGKAVLLKRIGLRQNKTP